MAAEPTRVEMTSDLIDRVHILNLDDDAFTAWKSSDLIINAKIERKISSKANDVVAAATADLLPMYLSQFVRHYHDDFYISRSFDTQLIVQLMAEGFLPIASKRYLRPKLHIERCVIQLNPRSKLHISRSTRKKSKSFLLSVNECFDEVVAGCHRQQ
jgi:hypothetical protein